MPEKDAAIRCYVALAILLLVTLRGIVVLLVAPTLPAASIYWGVALTLGMMAIYGLSLALRGKLFLPYPLPHLLMLNLALLSIWALTSLVLDSPANAFLPLYFLGFMPFLAYLFKDIPEELLILWMRIISVALSVFLIVEFLQLNTAFFDNGYETAYSIQKALRANFDAYGKSANFYRPNGLFGLNPEDTGMAMAVLSIFWLFFLLREGAGSGINYLLALITSLGLILSLTASNIIAAAVGGLIFGVIGLLIAKSKIRFILKIIVLIEILIIGIYLAFLFKLIPIEIINAWKIRVSRSGGDWGNILDFRTGYLWEDMMALFFGHGSLGLSNIATVEIGTIKIFFEYGLFSTIVFYSILIFPIILWIVSKDGDWRREKLPYVAAVSVGFITLWHYTSLLKTTNIVIFLALYSQTLTIVRPQHIGSTNAV
ncbi:MAG: hypothetical protein MO847_02460 [Candidatus Protistobacter heckmanni]|nr:hypothetical protein [Candidatus Protistobacter heckmanni]